MSSTPDARTPSVQTIYAYSEAQGRREFDIYLATWQVMNPGVEVYIVDGDRRSKKSDNPSKCGRLVSASSGLRSMPT